MSLVVALWMPLAHAASPLDGAAVQAGWVGNPAPAAIGEERGYVAGRAGYEGAAGAVTVGGDAEVRVVGPIAVRAGVRYGTETEVARPTVGVRGQILSQDHAGIDLGVAATYKPDGFTEPTGEFEAAVAVGRTFGSLRGLANVVYGQDFEGRERDGEVKLSAALPVGDRVVAALDTRLRLNLTAGGEELDAEEAELAEGEARWDLVAGPAAAVQVGPVLLSAQAGVQAVGAEDVRVGAVAVGGLGFAF